MRVKEEHVDITVKDTTEHINKRKPNKTMYDMDTHKDMRGHHGAVVLKWMQRGCYLTERVMRVWIS